MDNGIDNLAIIVRDFLKEHHGRDVELNLIRNMCIISHNTLQKEGHAGVDLSKKVIYAVKNALVPSKQSALEPLASPAPQQSAQGTPPQVKPLVQPQPPQAVVSTPSKNDAADEFMSKLQELELTRNAALAASISKGPQPVPADFLKPSDTQPTPPQSSTIVYLNNSPRKITKAFFVNGCDRKWNYFHERAVTSYNGPSNNEDTSVSLCAVSLPSCLTEPFIIVEIQGTTGHTVNIPCVCEIQGRVFNTWKPVNKNVATFLSIAFPWTIKLLDTNNIAISLGKDDAVVTNVTTLLNGYKRITLDRSGYCNPSDTLLFMNASGDITSVVALRVLDGDIEVGPGTDVKEGYFVCNKTQQMTLLFTTTKIDSNKTG